jgi:hypothetical protein
MFVRVIGVKRSGSLGSMRRFVALLVGLVACESSHVAPEPAPGDDAGVDPNAVPDWCPATSAGISKGPWSLAVNDTSAKVRWEACHTGTSGDLFFAPEAGGAEQSVPSTETPITITQTNKAIVAETPPDWAGVYYTHEASLTGLAPSTCYNYRLAALDGVHGRFCTMRRPGDNVRFMAIGDTNPMLGDNTKKVLAQVLPKNPDFVLHGGDIQYYDSGLETWASWFPIMAPMLQKGAFFPAVGNHEDEKQSPGELTTYSLRFFGNAGFDGTSTYYRVTSGGVWFFSIDTELPIDPQSEQALWLTQKLTDASATPGYRFSIVFMHRPLLTCGDTGDNLVAQQYFEALFKKYQVPLVLQAHMHGYERFEYNGITYVTTAGGGGAMGDPDQNKTRAYCNTRVVSGAFFHATVIDVTAGMLTGTVIDADGTTRDSFAHAVP